jgi:uncharacterized protein (TIGR02996 family)
METAFLADIAAHPDDDTPRLIFADWLQDNGQPERAELIRLQCRLDPDRDNFDKLTLNPLREQIETLNGPLKETESNWLIQLGELPPHEYLGWHVRWRRGFVDELQLPASWIVQYGEHLRQHYPLLRKLTLFRLNGWGQRLAESPHLEGIRELEFPCWYGDEDAMAIAASPYLRAVERVVCWSGNRDERQGRIFAQSRAWPGLRNLHLVSLGSPAAWIEAVNLAAGRPLATGYDFDADLFPFAPDFYPGFLAGKLPDGTQLFLCDNTPTDVEGVAFDPDGTPRDEPFNFTFPAGLVENHIKDWSTPEGMEQTRAWEDRARAACVEHLRATLGFELALIRVKSFSIDYSSTGRFRGDEDRWWGQEDYREYVPSSPYTAGEFLGMGGAVHRWVARGGFTFGEGGFMWCDRTGHVTST